MMRGIGYGVLLGLALMVGPAMTGVASADPIGPDCGTCQGLIVTLEFENLSAPNTTQTLDVTLTIDATGIVAGDELFGASIRDVAVKITPNTNDVIDATLVDAPGGAGIWTSFVGGLNADGCFDGNAGFICAQDGDVALIPGLFTWTWSVEIDSGTLLTGDGAASVKARFCEPGADCDAKKVGDLLSEDITLQPVGGQPVGGQPVGGQPVGGETQVPQPGSLMLIGVVLLGGLAMSAGLRRVRRRSE